MAVLAVLLIHMESREVGTMKPSSTWGRRRRTLRRSRGVTLRMSRRTMKTMQIMITLSRRVSRSSHHTRRGSDQEQNSESYSSVEATVLD